MAIKTRKLTLARVMKAVKQDNYIGFCTSCGAEADGCEPDMRKGHCDACDKDTVYGAEELLFMLES